MAVCRSLLCTIAAVCVGVVEGGRALSWTGLGAVVVVVVVVFSALHYALVAAEALAWVGLGAAVAPFSTESRELECDVARNKVTASRSGLHCTTASHFCRADFFFLRLKKQQHLHNRPLSIRHSLDSHLQLIKAILN